MALKSPSAEDVSEVLRSYHDQVGSFSLLVSLLAQGLVEHSRLPPRSARSTPRSPSSWKKTCPTSTGRRTIDDICDRPLRLKAAPRLKPVFLRLFSASSVEGIMENLKADGSPFATKQAEV